MLRSLLPLFFACSVFFSPTAAFVPAVACRNSLTTRRKMSDSSEAAAFPPLKPEETAFVMVEYQVRAGAVVVPRRRQFWLPLF